MDTLAAWREWYERCAINLCQPATQATLRAFGQRRFRSYLARYAHLTSAATAPPATLEPSDPWHLFETHLTADESRAGKRYKDWLFARLDHAADQPLDVLQGGATLLMRDVVRDYLRAEYSPAATVSLHQPLPVGEGCLTLEDLLPDDLDPRDEAAARELESIAARLSTALLAGLPTRARVALAAKESGLSLADPAVTRAAGCGKSMVNDAYHHATAAAIDQVRADYADEEPQTVRALALLVLRQLHARAAAWATSENSPARTFLDPESIAPLSSATDGPRLP